MCLALHVCPSLFAVSVFQRLIVCLEESLYIHNIRDMKVLHTIRETPPNPAGESTGKVSCLSDSASSRWPRVGGS